MKNISILGIFLGLLSSIVLFVALNLLMVVVFKYYLLESGLLVPDLPLWEYMLLYLTVATGVSSFTGGYIATRIAKNRSYVNSIILSMMMILYFVYLGTGNPDPEMEAALPEWMGILDCLIIIAFALLGRFFCIKTAKNDG